MVGTQFHAEFKSSLMNLRPFIISFIKAVIEKKEKV
jgi:CTP synthase (UTP-ammonia lyase)